jgi:hypothetical protein
MGVEESMMDILYKRTDGTFVATVNGDPYHVIPGDPLFEQAEIDGADAPFEPVPPQPTVAEQLAQARAAASMSRLDFAKLALREGWITSAEAKAWVPGNALPQIVTDIIAQHIEGADRQVVAEINALGQTVVNRNDLLLRLLMMSKKVTDAQMDAHFGVGAILWGGATGVVV